MTNELATFTTILAAFGAVASALIGYWIYCSQTEPDVVVYTTTLTQTPSIIYLVIENIGKGPAVNVRFEHSRSIPERAFGLGQDTAKPPSVQMMTDGPLIDGIPFFPPNGKRLLVWGQYWGLFHALSGKSIRIVASYSSRPRAFIVTRHHSTESIIEVNSYSGTDASDNDPLNKATRSLEKIAQALDWSSSGFKPLKVEVETKTPPQPTAD